MACCIADVQITRIDRPALVTTSRLATLLAALRHFKQQAGGRCMGVELAVRPDDAGFGRSQLAAAMNDGADGAQDPVLWKVARKDQGSGSRVKSFIIRSPLQANFTIRLTLM